MILLDTIGELPATYSLADVVFVGGSIVDKGGHNVLEPAAAGAAVVTGAHTHNFHAVVDLMVEAGALSATASLYHELKKSLMFLLNCSPTPVDETNWAAAPNNSSSIIRARPIEP